MASVRLPQPKEFSPLPANHYFFEPKSFLLKRAQIIEKRILEEEARDLPSLKRKEYVVTALNVFFYTVLFFALTAPFLDFIPSWTSWVVCAGLMIPQCLKNCVERSIAERKENTLK